MINLIFIIHRVHCYAKNNEQIDVEWIVQGKWVGSPDQYSGQNTDCLYMDWGAVSPGYVYVDHGSVEDENRKVRVVCIAKDFKGWQNKVGFVNDGSLEFE